jgi:hypothetical protein
MSRRLPTLAAVALAAGAAVPAAAQATYVGSTSTTQIGTLVASSPWVAVPETDGLFDPGDISGLPRDSHTSAVNVARLRGGGRGLAFATAAVPSALASNRMGQVAVGGSGGALAFAWKDSGGGGAGRVATARLSADGTAMTGGLSVPATFATATDPQVAVASDATALVAWSEGDGAHALLTRPAETAPVPLLGGAALPDETVEYGGGVTAVDRTGGWLVTSAETGIRVRRLVAGGPTPAPIELAGDAAPAAAGDGVGGLWLVVAAGASGATLVHVDPAGNVRRQALGATVRHVVLGVDRTTAVVAYEDGAGQDVFTRRVALNGTVGKVVTVVATARREETPVGLVADRGTKTTTVLLAAGGIAQLARVKGARVTRRGLPGSQDDGAPIAIASAGPGRVIVQTEGDATDEDFGCGGSAPDSAQLMRFAVFQGSARVRIGSLASSEDNC